MSTIAPIANLCYNCIIDRLIGDIMVTSFLLYLTPFITGALLGVVGGATVLKCAKARDALDLAALKNGVWLGRPVLPKGVVLHVGTKGAPKDMKVHGPSCRVTDKPRARDAKGRFI